MNKVTVKPTEHATGKDFYVWSIHQVHISMDHDSHIRAIFHTVSLHIFKHVFYFDMYQMLQIYWTQLHQRTGKEAIPYFSTVRNANAGHVRV